MERMSVVGRVARRGARWFLLAAALALFGSIVVAATGNAASSPAPPPVTTPNPRCGVAGVWKQPVLQSLHLSQVAPGVPEPGGYTWEALTPCNEVQMVRPCKYFANAHVSPPPECYDVSTGVITNGYELTFTNLVTTIYTGRVWLIGNEPDRNDQDKLTPAQYAQMYHYYYNLIKGVDPSATIATAGFSQDPNYGGVYTSGWRWADAALDAYETAYSTTMPIDVWNFHMYNTVQGSYDVITVENDIEE